MPEINTMARRHVKRFMLYMHIWHKLGLNHCQVRFLQIPMLHQLACILCLVLNQLPVGLTLQLLDWSSCPSSHIPFIGFIFSP